MTWLFYLYVFMVPLQNLQEKLPKGPTGINYANLTMALMVVIWVLARMTRRRPLLMRSPLNLPLIVLFGLTYLGMMLAYWSGLPEIDSPFAPSSLAVTRILQFFNGFLLFWLAAHLLDTRRKIRQCLIVIALAAPYIFRVFFTQLRSVRSFHFDDDMRVRGPFMFLGSNELGAFFVYSALMLGLLFFLPRRRWEQALFALAASAYAYGILYSYSRATQLAFGLAVILVACLKFRPLIVVLVFAIVTNPLWVPYSVRERWLKTEDEAGRLEQSAQSRKDFWKLATELWEQSPIFGHGVGSFQVLNPRRMDTHNMYLRTLAEQGVVGFAAFMTVWIVILMMCLRLWRGGPHVFDRYFGFCLMIATVGLMVANIFGDRFTHYVMIGHYWVFVGMAARLYANMRGDEAMPAEDAYGRPLAGAEGGAAAAVEPAPAGPRLNQFPREPWPARVTWDLPRWGALHLAFRSGASGENEPRVIGPKAELKIRGAARSGPASGSVRDLNVIRPQPEAPAPREDEKPAGLNILRTNSTE
ncbi:MAG TPA: O-antigen ligase family protein [Candidatus Sumerlaeota bacterium]|nr:O-antigen ligase family protein [Candidatus Sumerlaeota bacterium]HOR26969.1 O-antigen ligase family protein [Candidatus Sumerlaeota bacterium]HPK03131.1 O-antigen ligase family protein [Candidatus Sumerlaeota bacterium]